MNDDNADLGTPMNADDDLRKQKRKRLVITWVVLELLTILTFIAWWVERPKPVPVTANAAVRAGAEVPDGTDR